LLYNEPTTATQFTFLSLGYDAQGQLRLALTTSGRIFRNVGFPWRTYLGPCK